MEEQNPMYSIPHTWKYVLSSQMKKETGFLTDPHMSIAGKTDSEIWMAIGARRAYKYAMLGFETMLKRAREEVSRAENKGRER